MTTIRIHALAIGTLALLILAGTAAAQTAASPILNAPEVRRLVASAQPGDNARLSGHFAALAERYAAEARRHTAMAKAFVGNPSRSLATGMSAHCTRLAELSTQSATTVRELATYHQKLASGAAATPPAAGARFEGGAGAPTPTDQELNAMAAKARTPADHRALQEYFLTLAKRYTAEADEHVALAQAYRGTRIAQAAVHCDRLISLSRDSAKDATAAAMMHEQLAGIAR
ncbi:MAG: hypothetical protein ABL993_11745 [Vicinamibacterales bacterium]